MCSSPGAVVCELQQSTARVLNIHTGTTAEDPQPTEGATSLA